MLNQPLPLSRRFIRICRRRFSIQLDYRRYYLHYQKPTFKKEEDCWIVCIWVCSNSSILTAFETGKWRRNLSLASLHSNCTEQLAAMASGRVKIVWNTKFSKAFRNSNLGISIVPIVVRVKISNPTFPSPGSLLSLWRLYESIFGQIFGAKLSQYDIIHAPPVIKNNFFLQSLYGWF